jgi:hypothetical protein
MVATKQIIGAALMILTIAGEGFAQIQQSSIEAQVERLIAELYAHPWEGAENSCSPMCWNFRFTDPMLRILEIGRPAQDALLAKLADPAIKDQVVILLGGLGDEGAVGPIINSMVPGDEIAATPNAKKLNLAAVLALTNITVAEVTWHHGGGIEVRKCPDTPKECWEEWWRHNKSTFRVDAITQSRRYSNYPNYGIYKWQ